MVVVVVVMLFSSVRKSIIFICFGCFSCVGIVTAKITPSSLSPSVGSQMKSSLAGLEELGEHSASNFLQWIMGIDFDSALIAVPYK